ncbi:MAG: N-acetyl-gamma-glutamyl-phosphate reductase [Planctomycetota bacterium]|jgi:N-acetyl-gamma-glutamyl-phosphate reductase
MIDVAVFGASGYGGQELLRYLAGHPEFRVAAATSDRLAGTPVEQAMPQLQGFVDGLVFTRPDAPLPDVAAAILAVPHGTAAPIVTRLPDVKIVDLSMDHRDDSDGFVYGLTETNRARLAEAARVANPGCFATAAILALAPLAERGLLSGDVTLAQTTGSSGSGATAKAGTHHPERAQDMRAYKVLSHQHEPEVVRDLERAGGAGFEIAMVPQSGPFARGIFTVAHARVDESVDVAALYAERYRDEFFVRVREGTPTLRHVARTNFCDIAVHRRGGRVVVLSAIDNLGKGMAGQAIQNLNLVFGLDETAGLRTPGGNP